MKFEPKTEKQIAEEGMMPDGTICDFEVAEAEDTQSKAGNDMIALKLKVWRPNGTTTTMRDWLVSTFQPKILGFAKSIGMRDAYDAGEFDASLLEGKCGKLKVGIDPEKDGYPSRNKVVSYVQGDAAPKPRREPAMAGAGGGPRPRAKSDLDDDIPF